MRKQHLHKDLREGRELAGPLPESRTASPRRYRKFRVSSIIVKMLALPLREMRFIEAFWVRSSMI